MKIEHEQNINKIREELEDLMKRMREEKEKKIKELERLLGETRDKSGNKMAELDRRLKDMEQSYELVN